MPPVIACLGWGSLVWEPTRPPTSTTEPLYTEGVRNGTIDRGGTWRSDGPRLPIEFARHSGDHDLDGGYVSLVIVPRRKRVKTLWTLLTLPNSIATLDQALDHAAFQLRRRENCSSDDIGCWPGGLNTRKTIGRWVKNQRANGVPIAGVVWTALGPKWRREQGVKPRKQDVIDFLRQHGNTRAQEYVRRAPSQIRTPYRNAIEHVLGWRPR